MQVFRSAIALLLVSLWMTAASSAAGPGQVYSVPEYIVELNRLSALASQPNIRGDAISELRGGLKVQSDGQIFEVNTGWMVAQFEKLQHGPNADIRDRLLQRISALKADAQAFQQPAIDSQSPRATLNQVLARSEFHQVHGPTWFDRLKFKIMEWLFRIASRFFGSSSAPVIGRAFVWTLVAIAVLVLGWLIYREMKRNARMETIMPEVLPVSAKEWSVWMSEAQAAAAKGLWRDAVHLAYWAGISFLEGNGAWRPDQARTPREYLRLMPAASEHRPALSTLTRQLEVTWYGNEQAGPETFAETLTHLENLGCRPV